MSIEIHRMTLRELAHLLGYKDVRSARRWCQSQGVGLHRDTGTKVPYVFKSDYETARLNSLLSYLKTRFDAKRLKQALSAYQAGDIVALVSLTEERMGNCVTEKEKSREYGEHSSRFYADLMQTVSGTRK